jgi:DNA polymerase-1
MNTILAMITADLRLAAGGEDGTVLAEQHYIVAQEWADVRKVMDAVVGAKVVAWDTETAGLDTKRDALMGVSLAWGKGQAAYLPLFYWKSLEEYGTREQPHCRWTRPQQATLWEFLRVTLEQRTDVIRVAHNASFDRLALWHRGIRAKAEADTMLMHHLIDENSAHGLKELAFKFTKLGGYDDALEGWMDSHHREMLAALRLRRNEMGERPGVGGRKKKNSWKRKGVAPVDLLGTYAACDADVTLRLYNKFLPMLEEQGLLDLFTRVTMPASTILLEPEFYGVRVDAERMALLREAYERKQRKYARRFRRAMKAPRGLNLQASRQVAAVLFGGRHPLPILAPSAKTGEPTLDKHVLADLLRKHPKHQGLLALRQHRIVSKRLSTYLKHELDETQGLHPHYKQQGTVTGRLSCSEPNVQNIVRGSELRTMFVAPEGYRLLEIDFAQAEFRVWGGLAKDKVLLRDAVEGIEIQTDEGPKRVDIHTATGYGFFKRMPTPEERNGIVKPIVFGTIYGRQPESISEALHMPVARVKELLRLFFGRYTRASAWLGEVVKEGQQKGYITTPFGRRRHLPGLRSPEQYVRAEAARMAVNSPIQSTVGDYTVLAMIRSMERIKKEVTQDVRLYLEVHDSFALQLPKGTIRRSAKIVSEECKRGIKTLSVPWDIEMKAGKRWGELQPIT